MKSVYCENCGFYKEAEFILYTICPHCNRPLIIDDEDLDNGLPFDLENNPIDIDHSNNKPIGYIGSPEEQLMRADIKEFGHNETWSNIENISNAKERLYMRELFKRCGGKFPTNIEE